MLARTLIATACLPALLSLPHWGVGAQQDTFATRVASIASPSAASPTAVVQAGTAAGSREEEALAELKYCEELASDGRWKDAIAGYERLAEKFSGTQAAQKAAKRATPGEIFGWSEMLINGPSDNRVDIVILGECYALNKLKSFDKRAENLPKFFDRSEVLREYESYFNYYRGYQVSSETQPSTAKNERETALNSKVTDLAAGRSVAVDQGRVQAVLKDMPHQDGMAVVYVYKENWGIPGVAAATIGAGAKNLTSTLISFGGTFAKLSDETDKPNVAFASMYSPPDAPNVSRVPSEQEVPWAHWIEAGVSGIGVYPGGAGRLKGFWKPTYKCVMDSARDFCPPCREAIVLAIYRLVDPIDSVSPAPFPYASSQNILLEVESNQNYKPIVFTLETLEPKRHKLEIEWFVLPEAQAPKSPGVAQDAALRAKGSPLPPIDAKPHRTKDLHRLELHPNQMEPGRWRVICRVRDETPKDGRDPWVLQDKHGLLQSERAWWLDIPPRK